MKKIIIFFTALFVIFYGISQTDTFKYFKAQKIDNVNPKFNLIDMKTKQPVSNADLLGKPYVVGFGYTNCIDICPVTLATLSGILAVLDERYGTNISKNYNAVFITLDPNRDTPEVLSEFISNGFDSRIIGLTGSEKAVKTMGDNFKIEFSKYGDVKNNLYTMLHPIYLYLVDANGKYVTQIAHTIKPELAVDIMIKKFGVRK